MPALNVTYDGAAQTLHLTNAILMPFWEVQGNQNVRGWDSTSYTVALATWAPGTQESYIPDPDWYRPWIVSDSLDGPGHELDMAGVQSMTLGAATSSPTAPGGQIRRLSYTDRRSNNLTYDIPIVGSVRPHAFVLNESGHWAGTYYHSIPIRRVTAFTYTYDA